MANFSLRDLEKRLQKRAQASADASYTRQLLDRGVAHCAKKLGEEAIETVLAAISENRERLTAEAADLIYHLLVVLRARGITLADVEAVLAARTRQSGLEEKAARKHAARKHNARKHNGKRNAKMRSGQARGKRKSGNADKSGLPDSRKIMRRDPGKSGAR
jgi:phosphoribosyl-ATP pyrophosphohydrolase